MKVFVAGATGVVGTPTVDELVAAGHDVTAVARSPEKVDRLRRQGATPVEVDLFDPGAVTAAVDGHDAVVNLATNIPPLSKAFRQSAWAVTDRLRREAAPNLARAAMATGADVFVQESLAFAYGPHDGTVSEEEPLAVHPVIDSLGSAESAAAEITAAGARGVVLRFGQFYALGASHTEAQLRLARLWLSPTVGPPDAEWPYVHADDVATAVVAALGAPAGAYHVFDGTLLTRREADAAFARAVGHRRLLRMPAVLQRAMPVPDYMLRAQRPAAGRLTDATGWKPRHRSLAETLPELVRDRGG